jgi:hypothetical protein
MDEGQKGEVDEGAQGKGGGGTGGNDERQGCEKGYSTANK